MANTAIPRPAARAATAPQPGRTLDPIQRQAAIENALGMALHLKLTHFRGRVLV
jgi:hypothetical protein